MTLRELMDRVDEAAWTERVPSVVMIMESGSPVAASERMGDGIEVTAFENGYVIYENGRHATVFPLYKCRRDYVEKDVKDQEHGIPFEVFADQPSQIRAFMEGERRLVHNGNNCRRMAKDISYDACGEGWDLLSDEGASDPLRAILEREIHEEETEVLHRALESFTEKQRFILFQCVVHGRMQIDVANEMGTTRMNVTISLQKSLKKLREVYGISGRRFERNHFYRPE